MQPPSFIKLYLALIQDPVAPKGVKVERRLVRISFSKRHVVSVSLSLLMALPDTPVRPPGVSCVCGNGVGSAFSDSGISRIQSEDT